MSINGRLKMVTCEPVPDHMSWNPADPNIITMDKVFLAPSWNKYTIPTYWVSILYNKAQVKIAIKRAWLYDRVVSSKDVIVADRVSDVDLHDAVLMAEIERFDKYASYIAAKTDVMSGNGFPKYKIIERYVTNYGNYRNNVLLNFNTTTVDYAVVGTLTEACFVPLAPTIIPDKVIVEETGLDILKRRVSRWTL